MLTELFLTLKLYGYLGIFLISLISASTIIFPIPSAAFVFASGAILNPLLVGLIAGIGAALGEFVGYGLGIGSRKALKKKWKREIEKIEKLFQKYGGFLIIVIFAATPLPDDLTGIVAGILKYPVKKFFIASLIGKIILHLALAYAGLYGMKWILNILSSGFG
ncbi:MAG: VTT domain-containing protein [Candidatus Aenigmatarchaeota archaeon]